MFKLLGIKSEFSKNVATLFSGTLIGQALPIIISPLLSRIYSPEDFGEFGLFMAIISILSVLATVRFEHAIVLPKNDSDATHLISLSLLFTLAVFIASFLSILLFKNNIIELISTENKRLDRWIYLVPFSVLLLGTFQTLNYWSSRNKTFKLNALSRVFQSTGNVVSTSGFGYFKMGGFGLIFGYFLGQLLGVFILIKKSFHEIKAINKGKWIDKAGIKRNFREYKDFAFINTPHALIGSFQENGIIFLITYFFSSTILGYYSFAIRILNAPIGIIGYSFYQVFYQEASLMFNEGKELKGLVLKMYKRLLLIGGPFFLLLFLISPQLFTFVFGEQWRESGEIARILIPWLFLNFLVTPVSCLPLIVKKQKEGFLIQIIDISFKYGAIIIGGITGNYKLSFLIFTIWGCILMLFAIWWYYKLSLISKEKLNEIDQ